MEGFGKRIKQLRKERELTIDMVVIDMNNRFVDITLNKSMLSRWENDQNEPSLEYAKYLSMYYNVSLDYLIGLTDVRTPSVLLARKKGGK